MKNFKLWITFIAAVSLPFAIGLPITVFLTFLSIQTGLVQTGPPVSWLPLAGMVIAVFIVSLLFTIIVSRHFFKPIHELIHALDEVVAGNFHIRLPANSKFFEMQSVSINFNKMMEQLNSIELLQSDFIQNVSHEIKTPLAAIEGYASLLITSPLSEEQTIYVSRISESSKRLSSLTGSILKLSKLENQKIVSDKQIFSLDEQICQAVLSMEPLWSPKNLDMSIDLPKMHYYGNEELMYQIWSNLFSNAVKFTPMGGHICIHGEYAGSLTKIVFKDSGIGMTKEIQDHIFEKFYQGEPNRSMEGNGIGLALVKKILTLCNGSIEVVSRPGHGSTFTVFLPNPLYEKKGS